MQNIQQGDMLKISGLPYPMIVVSNDFYNQEGKISWLKKSLLTTIMG